MPRMSQLGRFAVAWRLMLAAAVAAAGAAAGGDATPIGTAWTPVAHSALLVLEAARQPQGLALQLRRSDGAALAGTDLSVSIDGRAVTAAAAGAQRWSVRWPQPPASGAHRLEVMVAHDGIREVLDGTVAAAAAAPVAAGGSGLLRDHKQLAWWILNIAIVLIAVIAISRRMS
jgi:hypothetical protein